jgi:hypothetical protein
MPLSQDIDRLLSETLRLIRRYRGLPCALMNRGRGARIETPGSMLRHVIELAPATTQRAVCVVQERHMA